MIIALVKERTMIAREGEGEGLDEGKLIPHTGGELPPDATAVEFQCTGKLYKSRCQTAEIWCCSTVLFGQLSRRTSKETLSNILYSTENSAVNAKSLNSLSAKLFQRVMARGNYTFHSLLMLLLIKALVLGCNLLASQFLNIGLCPGSC